MERVELVNDDPVACAIYTNRIFHNVLKDKRCSPFKPYVVVDYFKRVEFQQRGSAHVHTILWLEEAPQEEVSSHMPRTLEMVETLLTLDTDLLARPRTQIHAHTHLLQEGSHQVSFRSAVHAQQQDAHRGSISADRRRG